MLCDDVTFTQGRNNSKLYKNNNKLLESAERYMEPEIIIKRMVGECSSSVTDSTFYQVLVLVAAPRLARGVRGHTPPPLRICFQMVQFGAFWCIFGSDFVCKITGMRFFRNFHDLRGHSRGNPRSGLIFMGGGGYHKLCVLAGRVVVVDPLLSDYWGSPLLLSYGGSPPTSPASHLAGLLRRRDPSTNPGPIAWWVSVGN